jgi:hypothetical protein
MKVSDPSTVNDVQKYVEFILVTKEKSQVNYRYQLVVVGPSDLRRNTIKVYTGIQLLGGQPSSNLSTSAKT